MIKQSFLLIIFGLLFSLSGPKLSDAASGSIALNTHTHTNALELKPASLENSFKVASVCFLGVGDCSSGGFQKGDDDMSIDTANQCIQEGFTKLNCNSVQEPDGLCPYNAAYGKECKCKTGLITCPAGQVGVGDSCNGKYKTCQCSPSLVTCASNQNGGGASCGGKYEYCTCKPEYQYSTSNCTSPRYLTGATCGGKYTGCTCPSSEYCQYGCASYYASPCGSICASCKTNPDCDVTSQNCTYGCALTNTCGKCTSCKSNPDCDVTSQSCSYGCASTNSCGKCISCKGNPDCNVTSQSCPYGCASTNSCGKCTSCKGNPDCDVTSQSCSYGCASTNSCGKCTSCKGNPDCNVTSLSCSNGCASTNSCGKCTSCKTCSPTCTSESNCRWGTSSVSNGCGGTCTKCLPACQAGYTYNYSPSSDCFFRPARHMYQPSNRNCGKCVCDNSNSNCGGRACSCMII